MITSISSPGIKRIYLDVCVLCRPFDDQRQMRIALETDARAELFVAEGLGPADAAHLAFAEQAQADFLTVNDRLLRQCHRVRTSIWYGNPPIFCERENLT